MPRFILIDHYSGYIFGDTADLNGWSDDEQTPIRAAKLLDESLGEYSREYEHRWHKPRDEVTGYHVYRVDIDGSEVVGPIHDGQDQELINEVDEKGEFVGFVEVKEAA